ncbi:peroxisomal N(1)-acetyl-spermine/spermidine oxidase-like [Glandiceps talaboti]
MASLKVNPTPKVVIIGAGIAGLSAAKTLINNGITNVKILEATSRIGGRIQTQKLGNGIIEMGANWIHGVFQNPIFNLAQENKLFDRKNPRSHIGAQHFYTTQGNKIDEWIAQSVRKVYHEFYQMAEECSSNDTECCTALGGSVGQFLWKQFNKSDDNTKFSDEENKLRKAVFHWFINLECCISGCHSMDDVALQPFGEYTDLGGGDRILPGGYQSLLEVIQANIPEENILMNKAVGCIKWNCTNTTNALISENDDATILKEYEPVILECKNNETVTADHVIVTTSLGFLKYNAHQLFQPQLPADKLHAIHALGYGTAGKIFLEYEDIWWDKDFSGCRIIWDKTIDVFSGEESEQKQWYHKLYQFTVNAFCPNALYAYMAGQECQHMETLSQQEVATTCTAILKKFLSKGDIPEPNRVIQTSWYSNPYTRGSYSYVAVDSTGEDIDVLAKPLPYIDQGSDKTQQLKVLFAGEATHRTFYSTTHGALLSGEREADRIIAHYQS